MGAWDQGATLTSPFLLCPKEVRAAPAMAEGQLGEGHGANSARLGARAKPGPQSRQQLQTNCQAWRRVVWCRGRGGFPHTSRAERAYHVA